MKAFVGDEIRREVIVAERICGLKIGVGEYGEDGEWKLDQNPLSGDGVC